jgi:hypothetical protein
MKMKRNVFLLGMLAIILTFGMTVVGCGDDPADNNGGGGGSETGNVSLTNETGIDLRKLKITNGGKQVKYDEVVSRNANYPSVPRGLCTISFDLGLNGKNYSHNFTVGSGETVSIRFTSNYNFVITRSGGSGTNNPGGSTTEYGSVTVKNSSGAALTLVQINVGGSTAKSDSAGLNNGASRTYTNIPVGSATVNATRKGNGVTSLSQFWNGSVTVTKNSTATITVTSTGWR